MKFLCLTCDTQMKTVDTERQRADATMAVVLECPDCFGQVGMLMNPMETRLLDSLDVSVCPVGGKGRAAAPGSRAEESGDSRPALPWTAEAEERLARVPTFVRDTVRSSVEDFARANGHAEVSGPVMALAREAMGM